MENNIECYIPDFQMNTSQAACSLSIDECLQWYRYGSQSGCKNKRRKREYISIFISWEIHFVKMFSRKT